jgi:hypothetical protein
MSMKKDIFYLNYDESLTHDIQSSGNLPIILFVTYNSRHETQSNRLH